MMNNELRPYADYKSIDLPWIDVVPTHWKILRNKNIMSQSKTLVGKNHKKYKLLSLTLNGVIARDMSNPKGKFPKEFDTYQVVSENDLVFCLFDIDETPRTVGLSPMKGMITGAYNVFNVSNANVRFLYYYYLALDNSKLLRPLYTGLRKVISADTFLRTKMPIPSNEEQDQIVKYLDNKLAKINKFIKAKKKLIAVLKEQKQAIINQAVTKGLDTKVKMKPSGIEWLGDVPEHWKTSRCKYLFSEMDLRSKTGTEMHLSMSQKYGLVSDGRLEERRLLSESYVGGKICVENDLVLNRLKAHLGVFALASQKGVISPDYTVLRPNNKILPRYAEAVLKSSKCRKELRVRVRGIVEGFWRLYTDDFSTIVLPLPDYDEQVRIMKFIEVSSTKIDNTIERIESEIELISEFKNSIISDVVSGKVDVRHITIDESENMDIGEPEIDEALAEEEGLDEKEGDE